METPTKTSAGRQARLRGLAGFVGMAVACVVLASVTVLFGQASSEPWLPETPSNVAAMQRCEGVHGTAARRACAEAVVAQVKARGTERRFAANGKPTGTPAPAN